MLWPNFQDTQQGTKNAKDDANTTNMYYDKDITFLSLKKSCTDTQMFCESKDNCGVAGGQKKNRRKNCHNCLPKDWNELSCGFVVWHVKADS